MSWYDPIYDYFPDEIAEELGLSDAERPSSPPPSPAERPLAVYAGPFRPRVPATIPPAGERALVTQTRSQR
ncbi:MAG: hypothetical protein U0893_05615 [Chloroflexota bacterium]